MLRGKRNEQIVSWVVFLLSLLLTAGILYAMYSTIEPFFRISTFHARPDVVGEGSSGLLPILINLMGVSPVLWYLFASFLVIVFLHELSYAPVAILHHYLQQRRVRPMSEWKRIPMVSIIVPAYNEEKVIEGTVKTLLEIDYPNKEILVVNDGSTDNTEAILRPYALEGKIRLINRPNAGKAAALNLGFNLAQGEIIVTIDADGALERKSVTELIANYEDSEVVAVAGNVKVGNRTSMLTKMQAIEYLRGINLRRRSFDLLNTMDVLPGALASFRKSALDSVGLYERDTVTEDMDQTLKLVKTRRYVIYEPDAVVHTEAPEDLRSLFRQRKRWYGGTVQVLFKHSSHWWRHGSLSLIGYPYLILSIVVVPLIELTTLILMLVYGLLGRLMGIALAMVQLILLELALSALTIYLDKEDWSLLLYVPFYTLVYRYVLDVFRMATYWDLFRGRMGWERSDRYGRLAEKITIR
jgi:poly-beta-1,6 N-acetyl-D-glucosamine synthase